MASQFLSVNIWIPLLVSVVRKKMPVLRCHLNLFLDQPDFRYSFNRPVGKEIG
jgi:hypothetical protein